MVWPGERHPALTDAQEAYEPANSQKLASFKAGLLAERVPGGKKSDQDISVLHNLVNDRIPGEEVKAYQYPS